MWGVRTLLAREKTMITTELELMIPCGKGKTGAGARHTSRHPIFPSIHTWYRALPALSQQVAKLLLQWEYIYSCNLEKPAALLNVIINRNAILCVASPLKYYVSKDFLKKLIRTWRRGKYLVGDQLALLVPGLLSSLGYSPGSRCWKRLAGFLPEGTWPELHNSRVWESERRLIGGKGVFTLSIAFFSSFMLEMCILLV